MGKQFVVMYKAIRHTWKSLKVHYKFVFLAKPRHERKMSVFEIATRLSHNRNTQNATYKYNGNRVIQHII